MTRQQQLRDLIARYVFFNQSGSEEAWQQTAIDIANFVTRNEDRITVASGR